MSAPIVVYNNNKLEKGILVQLCDEAGNFAEESGIRIQMAKDVDIKVRYVTRNLIGSLIPVLLIIGQRLVFLSEVELSVDFISKIKIIFFYHSLFDFS